MQAISWCYSYLIFDFLPKYWNVGQEWGNNKNLNTKRAFQLKLKGFFVISEGSDVGEIQELTGASLEWSYEIF